MMGRTESKAIEDSLSAIRNLASILSEKNQYSTSVIITSSRSLITSLPSAYIS